MWTELRADIKAALDRDPAARSQIEVMVTYPSVHVLFFHRLAHALWLRNWRFLARWLSQFARFLTGIEIHPGATVGPGLFIDHGAGVVIGETAEIGSDVTLYQGVTLGGTSLERGKRHPTLEDGVIVGAGAKILGPIRIGRNARVGSNAVVLKEVQPETTVIGVPAREVQRRRPEVRTDSRVASARDFCAYGIPTADLPDPVARSLEGMVEMICSLRGRIETLERELAARDGRSSPARATPQQDDDEHDFAVNL
ncbi:serine O-acetyltransferase EpsC [Govanella unica]|uniref:Serine acetyltransferase n=1 Tax=Govanella unica TaxID=2975056 RepID=A0A9X3TXG6_9PROT|nr:serine O-acetyltransferase EpsC [Govania unica]MDA5193556.1 serine O-acetyltransferase [Govania unica]